MGEGEEKDLLSYMQKKIDEGLQDPETKKKIEGWNRIVQLTLKSGEKYIFEVKDGNITVKEGEVENPDMRIEIDRETLIGLFEGTKSAAWALIRRKMKVKGSLSDVLKLKQIFK